MKGFDFIVAVIGLLGIGEILLTMEDGLFISLWMGFKPGGATPASFMSYAFVKRFSRRPERFGKGESEGVVGYLFKKLDYALLFILTPPWRRMRGLPAGVRRET